MRAPPAARTTAGGEATRIGAARPSDSLDHISGGVGKFFFCSGSDGGSRPPLTKLQPAELMRSGPKGETTVVGDTFDISRFASKGVNADRYERQLKRLS